jgi:hypothetical protein
MLLWKVFPEAFYYKHKDSRESAPTIDDLKRMVLDRVLDIFPPGRTSGRGGRA